MYRYFYTLFNVLLVYLVLSHQLDAQSIEGNVYDAETQEPLIGATIYGSDQCNSTTNALGYFSLSNCKSDSIVISYIGYESYVLYPPFIDVNDVRLNRSNSLLDQVTVTGSGYRRSSKQSIISIERIDSDRIIRENTPEIDDLLNRINGVQIVDGQANIRGGSGYSYGAGSRVMIILDGLPILQADAATANWRDIPTENIASIEVLKGASSIIYGSSALNGVINIETKDPGSTPVTEFSTQYRAFDGPPADSMKWWGSTPFISTGSLIHRRKIGKLDLTGNVFYSKEESFIKHKTAETKRGGLKLRYRFKPELIVGLNVNYNDYEGNNPFFWENYGKGTLISDTASFSITDAIRYNIDPYLKFYDNSGGHHKLSNRFYYVENANEENRSNKSQLYLSEYQYYRDLTNLGIKFTGGVLFSHLESDSELFSNSKFSQNNLAFYGQIEKAIGKNLVVQAGLRYESNNTNAPDTIQYFKIDQGLSEHSEVVARVGFNYSLNEYTQFRANWGQGYRYPAIAERFINTDIGIPIVANPELKPERGWSAELAYRQGLSLGRIKGFLDIAFFQMEYEDMMEFGADGFPPPLPFIAFQSTNIGNTRIRGLDCQVQSEVDFSSSSNLFFSLGYNYIDPKFKDFTVEIERRSSSDENVLKYRQKHIGKAHFFWEVNNWGLGSTYRYISKTEAIDLIFYQILEGAEEFDADHNDNRHIVDLILSYKFSNNLTLRLNAKNITNELYTLRPAQLEDIRSFSLQLTKKWEHNKS